MLWAGAAITIPESLQWVQLPANNDIIPLKRLLEAGSERSNVQAQVEVAATLRRCLSNPECLSWSFLLNGKPCRATERSSGIDFEAVGQAYKTLQRARTPLAIVNAQGELTDSTLTDVVASSFEQLFKGAVVPGFGSGTPHRYEPLRLFLLVLLWPGLMEPDYHNTIFKKLCSGMNCLSAEQRETLQTWLHEVQAPMLRDAIVALQQFITIYVNEYRCIDDHVASATKVLGILWASNRDSKRVCYKEVGRIRPLSSHTAAVAPRTLSLLRFLAPCSCTFRLTPLYSCPSNYSVFIFALLSADVIKPSSIHDDVSGCRVLLARTRRLLVIGAEACALER